MNSLKCFFCVLCLFFITGETSAQSSLTDTTARYLLFKHTNAWSMHDTETIDDIFNENAVYKDIAYEAEMHGRDEIKTFLRETFEEIPDFAVKIVSWFSCGNKLSCEWIMSGTPTKDIPDTTAAGKPFSVRGASVATIKDGKFERWTDYYEAHSFLHQSGVAGNQDTVKNSSGIADYAESVTKVSGSLIPAGPPADKPERIDAGKNCIVNLVQPYKITGTLTGTVDFNYRILVNGPCGSPPGTYSEEWIAYGLFKGKINKSNVSAEMSYTAKVKAGGKIEGKILTGNGLEGELQVYGNFNDGKLSYRGIIR